MSSIIQRLEQLEFETKAFGFYWENSAQVLQQIISECDEISEHLEPRSSEVSVSTLAVPGSTLEEELGDLLHATFSLCVFCELDPEKTLIKATDKFEQRFRRVQQLAQQQGLRSLHGLSFEKLMGLWQQAKMTTDERLQNNTETCPSFVLDPMLSASSFILADWPLCQVLLKNNAQYPWLILVPRRQGIIELTELSSADCLQLMYEINQLCTVVKKVWLPDKLNMGALGNIVQQFHYHVIGRFKTDALWPQAVWQAAVMEKPYTDPTDLIAKLRDALSAAIQGK